MLFDLIIKNGLITDGTGKLPFSGDIGVKNGKISEIGDLRASAARRVYDAKGLPVCPGFIDAHAHSELSILRSPDGLHKISQGITLEITGHCGDSVFPDSAPDGQECFADLASYQSCAVSRGFAVSQGSLAGHGTLRAKALGDGDRPLTEAGAAQMASDLKKCLEQGALGMSSGLEYAPGMYSSIEEMIPLAGILADAGAVYSTHMRSEGSDLLTAVDEALSVAESARVTTVLSHIKACGKPNHGKVAELLKKLDAANEKGLSVYADSYPYPAGCTGLSIVLPQWTLADGRDELLRILSSSGGREKIRRWFSFGTDVWENRSILTGWENLFISHVSRPENAGLEGKSLKELSLIRGTDEIEAFLNLLLSEGGEVQGILRSACEEDIISALSHPRVMICSDSVDVTGRPHPRLYGSHARFLSRYANLKSDRGIADAVHKMTGLPAQVYGLADAGVLKTGRRADITVFDPDQIRDNATFAEPEQLSDGIALVLVGGEPAYADKESLHTRTGIFVNRVSGQSV